MAYLGRPSAGDSPFAIGDRARRDTSAPTLPTQKNPTPRRPSPNPATSSTSSTGIPVGGYMQTPSPYGSVSDEARRRYEERYAKKQADAAAAAAAASSGGGGGAGQPQQQNYQQPPAQQQQQHLQPSQLPPRQQFSPSPGGGQQQRPPPIHTSSYNSPPTQSSYSAGPVGPQSTNYPPGAYPPQTQQTYGGRPGSLPHPPAGYQSPPPQHQQQQQQQHHQPPMQQQQQRYSGPPGGGQQQWEQRPPPPQQQQHQQQWQQPAQIHSPPPPQMSAEDQELRSLFSQFDSSRSGQLNSYDLQKLLVKDATMEAREDCVKMLMNIFDTDRSGSINFVEFEGLYRYIKDWHAIFLRFDRDNSGTIDRKELHQALLGFGFSLPSEMVRKLEKRFAPPPGRGGNGGDKGISFDRFLMACVTVKHFTEAFRRADTRGEGTLTLDYNQFMEMVLDAPS